mgnify:CR=1 FL=1
MHLKCLGSSSAGNCYLLENETECLMIECGISIKEVKKVMNFNIRKIVGCVATHHHNDHIGHLEDVLKCGIPIYSNDETVEAVEVIYGELLHGVPEKRPFTLGNFKITPFYVPHDNTPCFAYQICHEEIGKLLFLTDLEYCKYRFKDVNQIMIEANYSKDIINQDNPNFDHVCRGHMELGTTLEFLKANKGPDLRNVVLLHLSDNNSDDALFAKKTKEAVGVADVYVADKGMEIELNKEPF